MSMQLGIANKFGAAVMAATIGFSALAPLSTPAAARDFDRYGSSRFERDGGRDFGRGPRFDDRRDYSSHDDYSRRRRRHDRRNLAIGAFAAIIGLAIAAEASRGHGRGHYDAHRD